MRWFANTVARFALGYWTGWMVDDPRGRAAGLGLGFTFLSYQATRCWRTGEYAHPNIRDFMVGQVAAQLTRIIRDWQAGRA